MPGGDQVLEPIYERMKKEAAQGKVFHIDDTPVRIMELVKENKEKQKEEEKKEEEKKEERRKCPRRRGMGRERRKRSVLQSRRAEWWWNWS
jgi:Transposase IS66 family